MQTTKCHVSNRIKHGTIRRHKYGGGEKMTPSIRKCSPPSWPWPAWWVWVKGGRSGLGCGWSFFHVERYTKGLRSTCLSSPYLLPPVVSESLYSSGIFWVQRGLRSLIFFHLLVYLSFAKTVYYAVNLCAFCRACELQYLIGPGRKFRQTERAWCKMTNGNSHSASDNRAGWGVGPAREPVPPSALPISSWLLLWRMQAVHWFGLSSEARSMVLLSCEISLLIKCCQQLPT